MRILQAGVHQSEAYADPSELYVVHKTKMSRNLNDTAESALHWCISSPQHRGLTKNPFCKSALFDLSFRKLCLPSLPRRPLTRAHLALAASDSLRPRLKSFLNLASNICHPGLPIFPELLPSRSWGLSNSFPGCCRYCSL